MKRIWVTGEALIDFIPGEMAGRQAFVPCCGGSTFNAAKAAALQGAPVSFIGAISTDMFGDQLAADLSAYGVDVSMAPRSDAPSTLAFVSYEGPEPRYAFFNRQSATQMTDMSQLSCEIRPGDILHLGSISLVENPGADSIAKFALAQDPNVLVSFDPNVRESIISDRKDWLRRFEMLLARSALLKLSDDDLQYIAPDVSPKAFARTCLDGGAALVVVTLGQDGMIAETREGSVHVPANRNMVGDTVGAGDTVMGVLMAELLLNQRTSHAALSSLKGESLRALVERAAAAAWLNCQSVGCRPPDRTAVNAFLEEGLNAV